MTQGQPITSSNYTVDMFQGPALGSNRMMGMGGVYVPIAEGSDGNPVNPASPAVRVPHSYTEWDYDVGAGFSLPASFGTTDFFNTSGTAASGHSQYDNFVFLTTAATLQSPVGGIGVEGDMQQFDVSRQDAAVPRARLRIFTAHAPLATSLFGGQLYVGAGPRFVVMGVYDAGTIDKNNPLNTQALFPTLFQMSGWGVEGGVLVAPTRSPVRIGAVARSIVHSHADPGGQLKPDASGNVVAGTAFMPKDVELPWDAELGVAWQIGPRPLNSEWRSTRAVRDDELPPPLTPKESRDDRAKRVLQARYEKIPRRYLLLAASVSLTGAVANAIGVESMLWQQKVDRSGEVPSWTPRIGVETELIPSWVQLRAGSYLEPARIHGATPRLHGTFGFDAKVLPWTVFGLFDDGTWWLAGAAVDYARDYFNWGVTVGVWH